MKKINYLLLLFISVTTYAQDTIISIKGDNWPRLTNAYYKDIDNDLNQFEGTYIYTNGTTEFKIVLVKKIQQYNNRYYEDLIIGEYEYKLNGVVVVSTLNLIDVVYSNQRKHNIESNFLVKKTFRPNKCPDCATNELRLNASIEDVSTERFADIIFRKVVINGQEALKANTHHFSRSFIPNAQDFSLPRGEMIFYKQ